jgi:hypothetical protein
VEKSGRGESQNRFSPQLGKDARKSAFSLVISMRITKFVEKKAVELLLLYYTKIWYSDIIDAENGTDMP